MELSKLEAKIREAVPNGFENREKRCCTVGEDCGECHLVKGKNGGYRYRNLNLQDVLIALILEKKRWGKGKAWERTLEPYGQITKEYKDMLAELICRYDLTKDYHHQSKEFYEFLSSLLNNE